MTDRVQEIADELIGTAKSLHDVLQGDEDQDKIEHTLYDFAFICDRCGWWASTEELNNETDEELCDECNDQYRDHDD